MEALVIRLEKRLQRTEDHLDDMMELFADHFGGNEKDIKDMKDEKTKSKNDSNTDVEIKP